MSFKKYIENNILLIDGAMATYYSLKTGNESSLCETANMENPQIITEIHREYLTAGAALIRTNTFAANTSSLKCSLDEVKNIIMSAVKCARDAAGDSGCFIAASIGPIKDSERTDADILNEYKQIIDFFHEEKVYIFWFETFSDYDIVLQLASYVKSKNSDAVSAALFSLNSYGFTRSGHSRDAVIQALSQCSDIAVAGFNCGTGSAHLLSLLKKSIILPYMAAVPNSGYPDKIMDRTVYQDNSEYFKNNILEMINLGVSVIGGCCGTTPAHIKKIHEAIKDFKKKSPAAYILTEKPVIHERTENLFYEKIKTKQRLIAAELDPPFDADVAKIMNASTILKNAGADLITIADSPLGKARVDSIMIAAKIKRETEIDVMPHICCRDKNLIAIRASILGAYIENIRNFLLVTGDPVSEEERNDIKSVFNFNSVRLMEFVSKMNASFQNDDIIRFGGALNPRASNTSKLIERVKRKMQTGAEFFLTQPVYTEKEAEALSQVKNATGAYIFMGIMPLVSYRNAQFIHNEFPGIDIPEKIRNAFHPEMPKDESEQAGVDISIEIIRSMNNCSDGLYFITPFNRAGMIKKIIMGVADDKPAV
ncbi:MAG: bifunctional homocysteine S-methyltransferase/methylenetetrahydrofolate reductase [Spirochaetes bacterium]|nr:bifunctional homocysteine S-methyltransferase/methylenetetrahydrofolate reductase [Spirochaetota bacterium]